MVSLLNGTKYENYALKNQILDKNNTFIEKKTGNSKFSFAFVYKDLIYGVWINYKEGKMFVSFDYNKESPYVYSMTLADHSPNTMMFNALKKYNFWKDFVENFRLGNVRFENQRIKHDCMELIKLYHSY